MFVVQSLLVLLLAYQARCFIFTVGFGNGSVQVTFGPKTPLAIFKGQITQNGKPVAASLSLDVMYKSNGHKIPVTLVQTNTLFNYDLRVNGLAFRDPNITSSVILRAQALSVYGGSATVEFEMIDDKLEYQNDIELSAPHRRHHKHHSHKHEDEDDDE